MGKKSKVYLSFLLAFVMILSPITTAFAQTNDGIEETKLETQDTPEEQNDTNTSGSSIESDNLKKDEGKSDGAIQDEPQKDDSTTDSAVKDNDKESTTDSALDGNQDDSSSESGIQEEEEDETTSGDAIDNGEENTSDSPVESGDDYSTTQGAVENEEDEKNENTTGDAIDGDDDSTTDGALDGSTTDQAFDGDKAPSKQSLMTDGKPEDTRDQEIQPMGLFDPEPKIEFEVTKILGDPENGEYSLKISVKNQGYWHRRKLENSELKLYFEGERTPYFTKNLGKIELKTGQTKTYKIENIPTEGIETGGLQNFKAELTGDLKYRRFWIWNDLIDNFTLSDAYSYTLPYTLKYSTDGNGTITGDDSQKVDYGKDGTQVTAVPNTGYTFDKWSDGSTENPRQDLNIKGNIKVTAEFKKIPYTLKIFYNHENGNEAERPYENGSMTYGENYEIDSPDLPGYEPSEDPVSGIMPANNLQRTVTYTAIDYKVTYDGNGGTGSVEDNNTYNINDEVVVKTNAFSKTGHNFTEWEDGNGNTYQPGDTFNMPAENVTLEAQWRIKTYNLNYSSDANGSIEGDKSQNVNHGSDGSSVTAVPDLGYDFEMWSDESTENPRKDENVTSNINVRAQFKELRGFFIEVDKGGVAYIDGEEYTPGKHFIEKEEGTVLTIYSYSNAGYDAVQDNEYDYNVVQWDNVEINFDKVDKVYGIPFYVIDGYFSGYHGNGNDISGHNPKGDKLDVEMNAESVSDTYLLNDEASVKLDISIIDGDNETKKLSEVDLYVEGEFYKDLGDITSTQVTFTTDIPSSKEDLEEDFTKVDNNTYTKEFTFELVDRYNRKAAAAVVSKAKATITVNLFETGNASIFVTADDAYELYLDGIHLGTGEVNRQWDHLDLYRVTIEDKEDYLLAAKAWDKGQTIVGLTVLVLFDDGTEHIAKGDSSWMYSLEEYADWNKPSYKTKNHDWKKVNDIKPHKSWVDENTYTDTDVQWVWAEKYLEPMSTPVWFRSFVPEPIDYEVSYDSNEGMGILVDSNNPYHEEETVRVIENDGFIKEEHQFVGWNTERDGKGTSYQPGDTFKMPGDDVTLYAQWAKPQLSISKTVDKESVYLDEEVTYSITVENIGNLDLEAVDIFDDNLEFSTQTSIDAGDSVTYDLKTSYSEVGDKVNTATAIYVYDIRGNSMIPILPTPPDTIIPIDPNPGNPMPFSDVGIKRVEQPRLFMHIVSDSAIVNVSERPSDGNIYRMDIEITAIDDAVIVGTDAEFEIEITNSGNTRLTGVDVKDTLSGLDEEISLDVGETRIFNASVPTTEEGTLTNTASATNDRASFTQDSDSVDVFDEDNIPEGYPGLIELTEDEVPLGLPVLNKTDHYQYIQGYEDNTVRPEANITREEVAAVFFRLLTEDSRVEHFSEEVEFSDVEDTRWSKKYIATLSNAEVLEGYEDNTFKPGNFITRAELAVVTSRFDSLIPSEENMFTDIGGHWASEHINSAAEKGWVDGYEDGTFKPDDYITRAEFVTLVNNVLNRKVEKENILPDVLQFEDLDESKWYYEAMQEAINSHKYERLENGYEEWTEIYFPELEF